MAENDSSLRGSLDYFLAEREKKQEELKRIDFTIAQLKQALGESVTETEMIVAAPPYSAPSTQPATAQNSNRPVTVRADEFFGLQYSEAARNYLRKVGHAVGLDQLLEALRNGGCKVGGADPKRVLYISLVRNTRDFVPTGNGNIGLREFYPSLPKAAAKATKGKKAKRSKKASKKKPLNRVPETVAKAVEPKKDSTELQAAVKAALGTEVLDAKEIVQRVEASLGKKVAPISVFGMLRNKQFAKEDGKYRLAQ